MRRTRRNGHDQETLLDPREVEQRVLDILRTACGPLTTVDLAEQLHDEGIPGPAVTRAVLNLLEQGQIQRTRSRTLEAA